MKTTKSLFGILAIPAIAMALGLSGGTAFAAASAFDTAANYVGVWGTTPPNNGSGFGAWSVDLINANNPANASTYLDTSSSVVSDGYSWATYAVLGANYETFISRNFNAGPSGSANLYNQTFSFDFSSSGVGPAYFYSSVSADVGPFQIVYNPGGGFGDDMYFSFYNGYSATPVPTGINFNQLEAGLHCSLMVSGDLNGPSDDYIFTITPVSGGNPLYTTSGTFNNSSTSTMSTSSFFFIDTSTTGDGFFNNLNITPENAPEPASLSLLAFVMFGIPLLRRHQRSSIRAISLK
jgi:hypothetical protein